MPWRWNELMDWLVCSNPFSFDRVATRAFFQEREQACADSGRIPVASAERLSGSPYSGGYDSKQIADNIKAALPDAKVLIVVREQRGAILSIYKQYVRDGGASSLRRFLRTPASGDLFIPMFDHRYFQYHYMVNYYISLFGRQSVLVLPYEHMRADLAGYVKRIVNFAGASMPKTLDASSVNTALSGAAIALKRPANWLLARNTLNPTGLISSRKFNYALRELFNRVDRLTPKRVRRTLDARMRRFVDKELSGIYRESNKALEEITGLDLGSLGYEL